MNFKWFIKFIYYLSILKMDEENPPLLPPIPSRQNAVQVADPNAEVAVVEVKSVVEPKSLCSNLTEALEFLAKH